jgi:hypothetical protein
MDSEGVWRQSIVERMAEMWLIVPSTEKLIWVRLTRDTSLTRLFKDVTQFEVKGHPALVVTDTVVVVELPAT